MGVLRVTQPFIPHFRAQKSGLFISTTSIGGFMGFPLNSMYHVTKFALGAVTLHLASSYYRDSVYHMRDFSLALQLIAGLSLLSLIEYFKIKPSDGANLRGISIKKEVQNAA
ncbi:SDR family NAD(P)-dependent oxidoreductase [Sphingobacterium sp. WOUb80]